MGSTPDRDKLNDALPIPNSEEAEIVTIIGIFVTAGIALGQGLVFYWTMKDARAIADEQHGVLSNQAVSMQGQLDEMKTQAALTRIQLMPQLRLQFAQPGHVQDSKTGLPGWFITPIWENTGATPAKNVWGWDAILPHLGPADFPADFDFLHVPGRILPAPAKVIITQHDNIQQNNLTISEPDADTIQAGQETVVAFGYIEYLDPLPDGQVHHIHWCNRIVPHKEGWSFISYRPECNVRD